MEGRPSRIFNPTPIRKCRRAAVSGLNIIHPATHTRWMFMDSPYRWQVAHTVVPVRRCSCLDAEAPPTRPTETLARSYTQHAVFPAGGINFTISHRLPHAQPPTGFH